MWVFSSYSIALYICLLRLECYQSTFHLIKASPTTLLHLPTLAVCASRAPLDLVKYVPARLTKINLSVNLTRGPSTTQGNSRILRTAESDTGSFAAAVADHRHLSGCHSSHHLVHNHSSNHLLHDYRPAHSLANSGQLRNIPLDTITCLHGNSSCHHCNQD